MYKYKFSSLMLSIEVFNLNTTKVHSFCSAMVNSDQFGGVWWSHTTNGCWSRCLIWWCYMGKSMEMLIGTIITTLILKQKR
jgi:hypothetical protein